MNKNKLNRYLGLLVGAAFVTVLGYLVFVTVRVATGISKAAEPARYQVRLQILNGCGADRPASDLAEELSGYVDEDIEIKVVGSGKFDITEVPESFLISRIPDMTAPAVLARKIGLDPSDITYKPLVSDHRHVSVTLVLGLDHEKVHLTPQSKEN